MEFNMKIAKFDTLESATVKLNQYNVWATPPDYPAVNITNIFKHTTLPIWWFDYTACIENGGLGKDLIITDESNLDTEEFADYQALIEQGYLPQPNLEEVA